MRTFQRELSSLGLSGGSEGAIGIDLGSRTSKAVLLYRDTLFAALTATGISPNETAEALVGELLARSSTGRAAVRAVVGTGYGDVSLRFADLPVETITEISCHAKGAHSLCPTARTVIDIGGQDCKAIRIDDRTGSVQEFILNDRCAAGTGRFLEKAAVLLDLGIARFSSVSLSADDPCSITSQCVVFAESEIISMKASGSSPANIAAGIHDAVARRIRSLAQRIACQPDVFFSGGVANNRGMRISLERALGGKVITSDGLDPVYTGALGAALFASE